MILVTSNDPSVIPIAKGHHTNLMYSQQPYKQEQDYKGDKMITWWPSVVLIPILTVPQLVPIWSMKSLGDEDVGWATSNINWGYLDMTVVDWFYLVSQCRDDSLIELWMGMSLLKSNEKKQNQAKIHFIRSFVLVLVTVPQHQWYSRCTIDNSNFRCLSSWHNNTGNI